MIIQRRYDMTIREGIKRSFKELVFIETYEEITVVSICKKASISRAAFYDCFANKEAVLVSIVEDEIVGPQLLIRHTLPTTKIKSSPQIMLEMIYQNVKNNSAFYQHINKVEKGSLLKRIITDGFAAMNKGILQDYDLPEDEKHYCGFFFAAANAALISRWLDNGMDIEPARLSQLFNKWTLSYWQKVSPDMTDW